jgi:D-arabinose 1-dehydrogenase-like Zn-dependent alcohol dehydrogenase
MMTGTGSMTLAGVHLVPIIMPTGAILARSTILATLTISKTEIDTTVALAQKMLITVKIVVVTMLMDAIAIIRIELSMTIRTSLTLSFMAQKITISYSLG